MGSTEVGSKRLQARGIRGLPQGLNRAEDDLGRKRGVAGFASSNGEWLMPSLHGTKTIALGTWSATHIVSCAAPDGISLYGSPVAFAAASSAPTMLSSRGVAGSLWRSRYSAVMPRSAAACPAKLAMARATPLEGLFVGAPDVE